MTASPRSPEPRIHPDAAAFQGMATQWPVLPVWAAIPARGITPVSAYRALASGGPGFILDGVSPEPGAGRYAYVCYRVSGTLRTGPGEDCGDVNPVDALRRALREAGAPASAEQPGLPEFVSGAVGYIGYEAAAHFEPSVGPLPPDPAGAPRSAFMLPAEMAVFDRVAGTVVVVALARPGNWSHPGQAYREAAERVIAACRTLRDEGHGDSPREIRLGETGPAIAHPVMPQARYEWMVREARRSITEGELIQAVVSQRLVCPTGARPLDVYEALSTLNPSPYTFLLDYGDFHLVGASPELFVRVRQGVASAHPIAGTRRRGATPAQDRSLEADLRGSEKERAEHVMLVDLARNDLGRVSHPGTVRVTSDMAVERYSHVMHLVSRVEGRLSPGTHALDALAAGFPTGTLTGAPKIRAMQLIRELEPEGRGPYTGAVGWFGSNGDMDTGTVIRSILMKDGNAHVQGGGGIVFDSVPELEYQESLHKMEAPLRAIRAAERVYSGPRAAVVREASMTAR